MADFLAGEQMILNHYGHLAPDYQLAAALAIGSKGVVVGETVGAGFRQNRGKPATPRETRGTLKINDLRPFPRRPVRSSFAGVGGEAVGRAGSWRSYAYIEPVRRLRPPVARSSPGTKKAGPDEKAGRGSTRRATGQ